MDREIGGYFEFELGTQNKEYHSNTISLNTGRNAFEYILLVKNISKVYVPYYMCDVMLEAAKKHEISIDFYRIDNKFELLEEIEIADTEKLLYVNYFGLKENYIANLVKKIGSEKLILDNTQSFFSKPLPGVDTIYSPRKYFGVSDGAYLITNRSSGERYEYDSSIKRVGHLIGRIESGASCYYDSFKQNDKSLQNQDIKYMSKFTKAILQTIDYDNVKLVRKRNFLYLHSLIAEHNELCIDIKGINGPMVYPFLINDSKLKSKLIQNNIYIATYWPEVLDKVSKQSVEASLVNKLLPLPVDQRYNFADMQKVVSVINEVLV